MTIGDLRRWFLRAPLWIRILIVVAWGLAIAGIAESLVAGEWRYWLVLGAVSLAIGLTVGMVVRHRL